LIEVGGAREDGSRAIMYVQPLGNTMIPPYRAALSHCFKNIRLTRGLSGRASGIFSSLDISSSEELSGVYDGEWRGSGEILKSLCPTTGEVLARVKSVRL